LINRGGPMLANDQANDAMAHFREALSLDPTRDESRLAYARALMKTERFTEAVDVLMEDRACRGCRSLISTIYFERGRASLRDGDYADAITDFDLALSMNRDPMTVLAKVDVYIVGNHGTPADAVEYLEHALRLVPIDQPGMQQLWWDKRMAVVYAAAIAGEHGSLDTVLQLPDPRRSLRDDQRVLERLHLHMYAASLQIYVKAYELGTERGLRAYREAEGAIPADELAKLREMLLNLYMQRVATHLAADDDAAARAAVAEALEIEPNDRILNLQNILATAVRNSGTARQMLGKHSSDPEYDRLRALVEIIYARRMLDIGQFTAARGAVEKAERWAPELLDTRLARAEIEAETRFDGLRKGWAEEFREIGTFSYPGGRINNYGRALAQLRFIQVRYDEAAARDYLRTPGFDTRLSQLDSRLQGFYPYDAELAPADAAGKAILVLRREESGELDVKVRGPRREHTVKVPGESRIELPLDIPGLAIIHAPGGRKALFAEPGVKIIVKI
jgi:tetratricopeptide (TPR) repeat protein